MDIEIKSEASVLRIQEGDVIVVRVQGGERMSREQQDRLGSAVRGALDSLELDFYPPVLIVDALTDISVIRAQAEKS